MSCEVGFFLLVIASSSLCLSSLGDNLACNQQTVASTHDQPRVPKELSNSCHMNDLKCILLLHVKIR